MAEPETTSDATKDAAKRWMMLNAVLASAAVVIPVVCLIYFSAKPASQWKLTETAPVSRFPDWEGTPFERIKLGERDAYRPTITNVQIVDLDGDGLPDILASDARRNRVYWYRQTADGKFEEKALGSELNSPAVLSVADVTGNGKLDIVVAVLGRVFPSDERIGQVVLLENQGDKFVNKVLLDDVRRVADVQTGDMNGNGRTDIVVAVFGYHHGEILWLENRGDGTFQDHLLFASDGPSHARIADVNGNGHNDIVALVSQDHEEIWGFENDGQGKFTPKLVHAFTNFDLGAAGLTLADLDGNGKLDLLVAAGDNLEVSHHFPQPWHGCRWLKQQDGWKFEEQPLPNVGGVYAAGVGDFTGNGKNDIVLSLMFNDWKRADTASVVILENDGEMNFAAKTLSRSPANLATLAVGDINGDGIADIVTGAMNLDSPPAERTGRLTLWLSRIGAAK